jgi:rubredoxin
MFQKTYNTVKINLAGGIISAGDLFTIVTVAEKFKIEDIQFGNRQQLFLNVKTDKLSQVEDELNSASIFFETDKDEYPNIVSSYVSEGVFHSGNWLSEGVYRDILDHFDYHPRLRINISDSGQTFTPFFTGHLNFVSSDKNNYWYLRIRFPKTSRVYSWNNLVYTGDIPRLSRLIEDIIFNNKNQLYGQENVSMENLYSAINSKEKFYAQPIDHDLKLPQFSLPYYEGFNQYNNKTWLGIYRRDELFPVAFFKDICAICKETKIGQIYTTPWKSIIIKGIEAHQRKIWDFVLGKFRINVRHASNELCWQLEDLNDDALNLKRYLIRHFDRDDVRTYGLCFAIETQPKTSLFGSVVIRKLPNESRNQRRALDRYDILYTKDFNPNSKEYIVFRKEISKEYLDTYLVSLSKYFYELNSAQDLIPHGAYQESGSEPADMPQMRVVHQCSDCFTIYDPVYGDVVNNIPSGTSFDDLPVNYECPTCNAPKENFQTIEQPSLV